MIEAMESSVNGGGGFATHLQSFGGGGGDSSEEELSVLPRHTKVVVTGNNRTKSVLVGLQGVVKKAVGLGGWHWLVTNHFFFVNIYFLLLRNVSHNFISILINSISNHFHVSVNFRFLFSFDKFIILLQHSFNHAEI